MALMLRARDAPAAPVSNKVRRGQSSKLTGHNLQSGDSPPGDRVSVRMHLPRCRRRAFIRANQAMRSGRDGGAPE
ncbi:hypothetical protein F2P81_012247 [Scophthalmus maximus]|uniref:Uncharacterized protein n=1 Tax=Scophthalmus maximus TaxID=52904 RepID=A0A6A4SP61_SCOMX|nr:hypothetical protein F2P81_012247 [Scophthalmus maximus]